MSLAPGTRLAQYEVIAVLGSGGMGEVYRARDVRLQRDVAIKVMADHLAADPAMRERFEIEARAVAALSHPNILSIHEAWGGRRTSVRGDGAARGADASAQDGRRRTRLA